MQKKPKTGQKLERDNKYLVRYVSICPNWFITLFILYIILGLNLAFLKTQNWDQDPKRELISIEYGDQIEVIGVPKA